MDIGNQLLGKPEKKLFLVAVLLDYEEEGGGGKMSVPLWQTLNL